MAASSRAPRSSRTRPWLSTRRPENGASAAGDDGAALRLDVGHQRLGQRRMQRHELHHAVLHAAPRRLRLPAPVQHGLGHARVVAAPVGRDRRKLRVRCEAAHVALVAEHLHALLLGGLRHRRRPAVVGQHVGAGVDERERRLALARRVEPGVQPQHAHLRARIGRAHAERERVDALHHLGHREAGHVAGDAGRARLAGDVARPATGPRRNARCRCSGWARSCSRRRARTSRRGSRAPRAAQAPGSRSWWRRSGGGPAPPGRASRARRRRFRARLRRRWCAPLRPARARARGGPARAGRSSRPGRWG